MWKPIASAPKDEECKEYLVYIPSEGYPDSIGNRIHVCSVRKISNGYMKIIGGLFGFDRDEPTMWCEIPELPQ